MYVCFCVCVPCRSCFGSCVARCLSQHFGSPYHTMFFCSCLGSPCSCFGSCRCMCVCRSTFGSLPQLSRPTAAFSAPCQHCLVRCSRFDSHVHGTPCSALLSRLGRIGFVACHVMTLCVNHGSSATPQLELDYTCSSGRSLCVLLACYVLTCGACHVATSGHVLESSCHCLLVTSCPGVLDM